MSNREKALFSKWDEQRRRELEARQSAAPEPIESGSHPTSVIIYSAKFDIDFPGEQGGSCVTSSLTAHIWKIKCAVGDTGKSAEDVLVVLEAMKTEVNVEAEEENVGRKVAGFGRGVREGSTVQAGDPLVYFE